MEVGTMYSTSQGH